MTDIHSALQSLEDGQVQLMLGRLPPAETLKGNLSSQLVSSNTSGVV